MEHLPTQAMLCLASTVLQPAHALAFSRAEMFGLISLWPSYIVTGWNVMASNVTEDCTKWSRAFSTSVFTPKLSSSLLMPLKRDVFLIILNRRGNESSCFILLGFNRWSVFKLCVQSSLLQSSSLSDKLKHIGCCGGLWTCIHGYFPTAGAPN